MESSSVNGLCRCCASEGAFKDIKTSYHWMGEEEVYGDMLRECFDVNLSSADQGGICEVCITQLRNASNFKKQVLRTENQFKQHLRTNKGFKACVKEERSTFDDESDDNDMDNIDDEDYVPEYEMPIKTESESEEKPKKRGAKTVSTRAKKSKSTEGDATVKNPRKPKIVVKKLKVRKKKVITLTPLEENPVRIVFKKCAELSKHQANIRTILLCSNATPIRRYGGVGFMCCFCPQQFDEAGLLKAHTLQSHDDSAKTTFMRSQTLPGFIVKLDVTDLRCTLCHTPFNLLEDLTTHIVSKHKKTYYSDVKSHILPFKFNSDLPRCVICSNQYNNFKVLLQHMNVHFRNHVCEICGRGFVNKKIFQTHMYRHNTGVFNCSFCNKVFDTRVKCKDHERATHVLMHKRSKCAYCGERFSDYTKKNDHEVRTHGAKKVVLNCLACNKTFDNQRSLTVHTKSHHLMEKRVPK